MRAVVITAYGGVEQLDVQDRTDPRPRARHVLVRVEAAGVNFHDVIGRRGGYPGQAAPPIPAGLEGAGEIVELGDDVAGLAVGDRVAWPFVPGSHAELVEVPVDGAVAVPRGLSTTTAAAVLSQGLTAQYLSSALQRIPPGGTALVWAAAGGVGRLLTQMLCAQGVRVIGAASTAQKREAVKAAGAEAAVAYDEVPEAVAELSHGAGADVVFDGVGGPVFDTSLASVRRRGLLVVYGAAGGPVAPIELSRLSAAGSVSLVRPRLADFIATREELIHRAEAVFAAVESGEIDVSIGGTYTLSEVAAAHRALESRETSGKLVLTPA